MGVTILQVFPVPENRTGSQTVDLITKRISHLGATQTGQFLVDCETYASVPALGNARTLHVLHDSERPASVFSVLETGAKTVCLTSDTLFDLLLLKLSPNAYQSKKLKIESKGQRFEIGDFLVKLGSVTVSGNFKGVLVEVEYLPCMIPSSCWQLMREFMSGFLGSCVPTNPPPYIQNKLNDIYQPTDTIHQYLDQFNAFRKSTAVRQ